jgi:hypothetical protein
VDQCLFVHKERQIDFGLYVGDIEPSADDEQLKWLQDRFEENVFTMVAITHRQGPRTTAVSVIQTTKSKFRQRVPPPTVIMMS